MRFLAAVCLFSLPMLPLTAAAAEIGAAGTTLVRIEERSAPGFSKQSLIPATQYIALDAANFLDGNLSLHLDAWGRVDLADKSFNDRNTDGDLTAAFLKYRFPKANGEVKAGRFTVFEGGTTEWIDGIAARADLLPAYEGLSVSMFGGSPVKLERAADNKGDYIAGGRLSYSYAGLLEIGARMVREGGMERNGPAGDLKNYRQLIGGDLWFAPHAKVSLTGRADYNTATGDLAESSTLLTVKPAAPLTVSAEYSYFNFTDYFSATNLRSVFNPDPGETFSAIGGRVTYAVAAPLEITADYKNYHRDKKGDSDRFGAECRLSLMDNNLRSGLSWHRLAGGTGINSYHELRGFALYNTGPFSAGIDAITQLYDNSIDSRSSAYETIATLGYRIIQDLTLSGDLSYGANPRMTEEVKGVIRLSFNYSTASKGAGQ